MSHLTILIMKQIILKAFSVFLALLMFSMQTFAYTSKASTSITKSEIQSVTAFDESEIYAAFAEVSELDQYLAVNDGKTYTEVNQADATLLNGISSTTSLPFSASADGLALGIPSFLWGCAFGPLGVLIVYLMTDNDKTQTKKAFFGCLAGTVIYVVVWVIIAAAGTAATTTTYGY